MMDRRRALIIAGQGSGYEHGTWEDFFYHIDKDDYASEYSVGEVLPLNLGTQGVVNAQIVAFNADSLSNGTGNAPVTFITKYTLTSKTTYNPALAGESGNRTIGTGGIGGWEYSALRTWVQNTVSPLIPQAVSARIVSVIKYSKIANPDETYTNNVTTVDRLWCPSFREVFYGSGTTNETLGPQYAAFNSQSARVKLTPGGTAANYWLRSVYTTASNASYISTAGKSSVYGKSNQNFNVLIGFCVN